MPGPDTKAITDIGLDVAVIKTTIENLSESVAVLEKVLIGNGDVKNSMVVRVSDIENDIRYFNKSRKSSWARFQWIITSSIAVAALVIIIIKA